MVTCSYKSSAHCIPPDVETKKIRSQSRFPQIQVTDSTIGLWQDVHVGGYMLEISLYFYICIYLTTLTISLLHMHLCSTLSTGPQSWTLIKVTEALELPRQVFYSYRSCEPLPQCSQHPHQSRLRSQAHSLNGEEPTVNNFQEGFWHIENSSLKSMPNPQSRPKVFV